MKNIIILLFSIFLVTPIFFSSPNIVTLVEAQCHRCTSCGGWCEPHSGGHGWQGGFTCIPDGCPADCCGSGGGPTSGPTEGPIPTPSCDPGEYQPHSQCNRCFGDGSDFGSAGSDFGSPSDFNNNNQYTTNWCNCAQTYNNSAWLDNTTCNPSMGCNDNCTNNTQCSRGDPNRICHNGKCRLGSNPNDTGCAPAVGCGDGCSRTTQCNRDDGNRYCDGTCRGGTCAPTQQCTGGASCGGWSGAPGNSCSTNNSSRTCTNTTLGGSTYCIQNTYTEYQTVNNCNSNYQCSGGNCIPRNCNSGVAGCGACSVACGAGGTQTCTYTTHGDGACFPQNFSRACDPAPVCGAGFGCSGNSCLPLYTISGNVFVDDSKNQVKDGTETNYAGGTSTLRFTNSATGAITNYNTGSGTFTSGQTLFAGSYRVEYTTLPNPPYNMTYPVNGPPPFFTVTVGGSCSTGSHNAASCSSGNITNLNFGISNSEPWIQLVGSGRRDSGYTNPIPGGASAACGGPNASIARGSSNTPGIIYSGDASYSFGSGQASANPYNWVAGGLSYPDTFNPVNAGVIRTSYDYYTTTVRQSGASVTDLTTAHCGVGGILSCQLSATLPNGIYRTNGNLTLTGGTYTFPANRNFVILVNGTLRIETNIRVPNGSTATFSVNGDIRIDRNVGEATITSYTPNVEGYYSTDRSFIIEGINSCTTGADRRFNHAGAVVVNAGRTGGTFQNNRDLCGGNLQCPVVALIERVDFILNAPQFIKSPTFIWQEVAP